MPKSDAYKIFIALCTDGIFSFLTATCMVYGVEFLKDRHGGISIIMFAMMFMSLRVLFSKYKHEEE